MLWNSQCETRIYFPKCSWGQLKFWVIPIFYPFRARGQPCYLNKFPPVLLHSEDNQFFNLFYSKDSGCQEKKCGKVKEYSFDQAFETVLQCHGQQVDVRIIIIHIICLYICPCVQQRDSCNQRVGDGIYGNNWPKNILYLFNCWCVCPSVYL